MTTKRICLTVFSVLSFVFLVIAINDPDSPLRISQLIPTAKPNKRQDVTTALINLPAKQKISNAASGDLNTTDLDSVEQSFVNIAGAYEYFDEEGIPEEAAAEYRRNNVLPYNPRVTECEDEWITTETQTGPVYGKQCTDSHKYQAHPYFELDLEVLEALSERVGDPIAAAVAADKLANIDAGKAMGFAIFASLISNKPGPIYNHAQKHFGLKYVADPRERAKRIPTYYALMSRAQEMGHPNVDLSFADSVPYELREEWAASARITHERLKLSAVIDGYATNYDD